MGIKTTILSVTAPGPCIEKDPLKASQLARSCNEYCSSLKNHDACTYGFFASLPSLFDTQACITELAYAFDVLQADGVTLFTRYGESEGYLGHEAFVPIWAELSRRKTVVFIHPTHPVDTHLLHRSLPQPMFDYPHETGRTAMSLLVNNTLRTYPGCKIILSHAGGTLPYLIHRVATMLPLTPMSVGKSTEQLLEEAGWFYYDVALSSNPATLKALFEIAKPENVLFGSDYPNAPTLGIQRFTQALEQSEISGVDLEIVFRKNAESLFPRLKDQVTTGRGGQKGGHENHTQA